MQLIYLSAAIGVASAIIGVSYKLARTGTPYASKKGRAEAALLQRT